MFGRPPFEGVLTIIEAIESESNFVEREDKILTLEHPRMKSGLLAFYVS